MKKIMLSFVMIAAMMLSGIMVKAQTLDTMDVPVGFFEQWNTYPADSASVLFLSLPIDYGYQLPEGWSIPMYEINETVNYSGLSLPIHANIPVGIVFNDTVTMSQGHGAIVAQSFIMSDVLTPMAYSLAASFLDSSLTSTVLPTIVASGNIHLENIIPLMEDLLEDTEDMDWLLPFVDSVDINNFISGGFPLDGFEPKQLIGDYKYLASNLDSIRDNGAIVAFGTRYDTLLHRRMLVGAGSKKLYQLSDTVNYTPFVMDYYSLSEYYPAGYDLQSADTMVVVVVSSANEKARVRGSRLFVDNLRLVSKNLNCGHIVNLTAPAVDYDMVHLTWNNTASPDSWEIEYGRAGFTQGRGTLVTASDSSVYIAHLDSDTEYDFYVRGVCADSAYTDWFFTTIRTAPMPTHEGIADVDNNLLRVFPNPANGSVSVALGQFDAGKVMLYSVEGRLLNEMSFDAAHSTIQLALPHTGVFFVAVSTSRSTLYHKVVNK